jgi:predicted nucleic acid-binding protein
VWRSSTSTPEPQAELRRLGQLEDLLDHADALLSGNLLIPIHEEIPSAAETLRRSTVATLDAIHLATALRLSDQDGLDALMTYDRASPMGPASTAS